MLVRIKNFLRRRLAPLLSLDKFPQSATPKWLIQSYLGDIKSQVSRKETQENLGWLLTPSHPFARKVASQFMSLDQNHLGNWSIKDVELWSTRQLEKHVIDALIDLYHGGGQKLEGYFTSGSTEGTIYAAWQGRNYLQSMMAKSKLVLIGTDLSHYSIKKAANLLDLPFVTSSLSNQSWSMDPAGLGESLALAYKKGRRGFLIALTHGYTQTGTSDDVKQTLQAVRKFKKTHPGSQFYVWIDAALMGFVSPFIENYSPFQNKEISCVVVDFHKFAQVPYPAGGVLYRDKFRAFIEQPISYLPNLDNTLLGSRPGYPVAATWAMIQLLGKAGFAKIIRLQLQHKAYFLKQLVKIFPKTEIITSAQSLTCGLVFHDLPDQTISKIVADKYGLFAKPITLKFYQTDSRLLKMYKVYFLPHSNIKAINACLAELALEKPNHDQTT